MAETKDPGITMEALLQMQADLAKKQAELDAMLKIMQQTMPATSGALANKMHNTADAVNINNTEDIAAAQSEVDADTALINENLTKKQKKEMEGFIDPEKQAKRRAVLVDKVHGAKPQKTDEQKAEAQKKRDVKYRHDKLAQLEGAAASKEIRDRYGIPAVPKFGMGDELVVQWTPTTDDMGNGDMLVNIIRRGLGEETVVGNDGKEHTVMQVKNLSKSPMKLKYYDLDSFRAAINKLAGKTGRAPVYETVYGDTSIDSDTYEEMSDAFEKGASLSNTAIDKAWKDAQNNYREAQAARIQELIDKGENVIDMGDGNYSMPLQRPEDFDDMEVNRYTPNALSEEIRSKRDKYNEIVEQLDAERNASKEAALKAYLDSMKNYAEDEVAGAVDQIKNYFPEDVVNMFGEAGSPEHFLYKALQGKSHYNKLMQAARNANEQDAYDSVQFLPEPARSEALGYIESLNDMREAFNANELYDTDTAVGRQYAKENAALHALFKRGMSLLPAARKEILDKRGKDMQNWQKSLDTISRVIDSEPGYVKARRDKARAIVQDAHDNNINVDPTILKRYLDLPDTRSKKAFLASMEELAKQYDKKRGDELRSWSRILNAMNYLEAPGEEKQVEYTDKDGNVSRAAYNNYYKKYAGMSTNELLAKAAGLQNYINSNDAMLTKDAQLELDRINDILAVNRLHPQSQIAGVSEVVYDDPKHPGKLVVRLNYNDELKKRIKEAGLEQIDKQNKKYSDAWFISRGINPSYESRMQYLQEVADKKRERSEDAHAIESAKYAADMTDEQREAIKQHNKDIEVRKAANNMRKQGVSEERVDAYVKSKGDKNAKLDATYNDEAHKVIADPNYKGNKRFRDIYNAAVHKAVMETENEYSKNEVADAYPISSFAKSYLAGRQESAWEDAAAAAAKRKQQSGINNAVSKSYEFNNTMYGEDNTDALDDKEGED